MKALKRARQTPAHTVTMNKEIKSASFKKLKQERKETTKEANSQIAKKTKKIKM